MKWCLRIQITMQNIIRQEYCRYYDKFSKYLDK